MTQLSMFSPSPVKASSLLGTNVVNPQGENLGVIKDVVLDLGIGRVAYVVVDFVRSFILGEKLFAIPYSAFKFNVTKNEYVLDIAQEQLKQAPGFDADQWPSMADEKWHRDLFTFYNRAAYWD